MWPFYASAAPKGERKKQSWKAVLLHPRIFAGRDYPAAKLSLRTETDKDLGFSASQRLGVKSHDEA